MTRRSLLYLTGNSSLIIKISSFFRVQKMKFHGEEQSVLGDWLIRFAAIGIFAYSTFNIVAGGLGVHNDLKNLLILATGGITIIQVQKSPHSAVLNSAMLVFPTRVHAILFIRNIFIRNGLGP